MNLFEEYYADYRASQAGFERFHNEVINMPRDHFSDMGLQKVRVLAGYLLLTENRLSPLGASYEDIMGCIANELQIGHYPHYRDQQLENRYFACRNPRAQYKSSEGRMFRHLMGLCLFFGLLASKSKTKKVCCYDKCREYYLSENQELLIPVARNNMVMLNINSNDFIRSLRGITVQKSADYRPTYAILRYIQQIGRGASKFELSVLLGRVDRLQGEAEILERALKVGRLLPRAEPEQVAWFFNGMQWKYPSGAHFAYAASQQPYFKFNSYLLLLESLELIRYSPASAAYSLTGYAQTLLADDVSYLVADLENLLRVVDDYSGDNSTLNDLILYQRNPELLRLAQADPAFIEKMNKRSLKNPIIGRDGKRQRSRLIAELAKILADYKCQYAQRPIFKMPNGKYYCEAHHILQFGTEDGPDITNNLVVLGPEAHKIIHCACKEEAEDVFIQLRANGALDLSRFREIITVYHCLTAEQVEILYARRVVTSREKAELLALLA